MKKLLSIILLAVSLCFISCNNDNDTDLVGETKVTTVLKTDNELFIYDFQKNEGVINIVSDGKWKIVNDGDWCELDHLSGEGNASIKFKISPYTSDQNVKRELGIYLFQVNTINGKESIAEYPVTNLKFIQLPYKEIEDIRTVIADQGFKNYITEGIKSDLKEYDTDKNGKLSATEVFFVKELKLGNYEKINPVNSLKGIEYFMNLKVLDIALNNFEQIDISMLDSLQSFTCQFNNFKKLDLSKNTKLKSFYCFNNQLEELNISNNLELETLGCEDNQLTALDISKNTKLEVFSCHNNRLKTLDIKNNINLILLICSNNQLTELDVAPHIDLQYLLCHGNELKSLDVSKNLELKTLYCGENLLKVIDISKNTKLDTFSCEDNMLTTLNLSNNIELKELYCKKNMFQTLDISKNEKIEQFDCTENNGLTTIYVWESFPSYLPAYKKPDSAEYVQKD